MKRVLATACAAVWSLLGVLGPAVAAAATANIGQAPRFQWGVKIPMRDGVKLNATLYLPQELQTPSPCLFTLTPYIADSYHDRGMYFATHGYTFAAVDVRGRGNSEGTFRPMIQEAQDGYDIVEWLARQTYCNGKVAMWGGSYAGYNQWATAKELPPHLATIVPVAAPYLGIDFPMRNNISYPYVLQWLTYTGGRASQPRIFGDKDFWAQFYRRWYVSGRPFREIDSLLGNPSPVFQEWIAHPEPDAYWDRYNPTNAQYAALQIPILTITGSYDDDQAGALEHYRRHMQSASPRGQASHYLVIGPWDHDGTRTPRAEVGGLKFGPASLLDIGKLHLDWYAWTMAEGTRPEFLQKQVAYYVMGAERWKYADSLDGVTGAMQSFFLDSAGRANDVLSSGQLGDTAGRGPPDAYRYDPRNVSGPEIDAEARREAESLTDQSLLFALRDKALVYTSAPFERDTEISGFFRLTAWISIDCPDTDLYVSVHEIMADGTSIRLTTDAIRARYRQGLRSPRLVNTREPLRYDFDRFTFVARQVKRGSRLRLVIAPLGDLLGTTFNQKNFNSGGVVAADSVNEARAVTVRLYHDRARPSVLSVPLAR
jgi:putative CocE/NonD family hydrolase